MINIPYVKEYGEDGLPIPITSYTTLFPERNRENRRAVKQKKRFYGNNKGHHLTVGQKFKYRRRIQIIGSKQIEHYDLK